MYHGGERRTFTGPGSSVVLALRARKVKMFRTSTGPLTLFAEGRDCVTTGQSNREHVGRRHIYWTG